MTRGRSEGTGRASAGPEHTEQQYQGPLHATLGMSFFSRVSGSCDLFSPFWDVRMELANGT